MKTIRLLATGLGLIALLAPPNLWAQSAGNGPKARLMAKYDTNKNGKIDGDEIEVVRKVFAAEPKGEFANYDVNKDGKLDDAEIAKILPPGAKGKGSEAKKGGGKKAEAKKEEPKP